MFFSLMECSCSSIEEDEQRRWREIGSTRCMLRLCRVVVANAKGNVCSKLSSISVPEDQQHHPAVASHDFQKL